ERRHHLRELRAAMVGGADGDHRETKRAQLHRRRACAENARAPPRPGARLHRGTQRAADRGDAAGADRDRGTPLNGTSTISAGGPSRRSRPGPAAGRGALLVALALMLGACSSSLLTAGAPPAGLPGMPRQAQQSPQAPPTPTQREHQRILAAYNGAYDDPKL